VLKQFILGSALHEHADAAQRVLGVAALAPDSKSLAELLSDPAPEVRAAAAGRCVDLAALADALEAEAEPQVQAAIATSLGKALATTSDAAAARTHLSAQHCTDAVRAEVALHAQDAERQRLAIEGIRDEGVLVEVALAASLAPLRLAAAERVHAPEQLRRLFDGAKDKDRGVARLARQRLDAIHHRAKQGVAADEILAQAEALAAQPGPIVMAAVELDRRWKALDLGDDVARRARWEAVGRLMQQRFDREREEQQAHARFDKRLGAWLASLQSPPSTAALPAVREELLALRAEASLSNDERAMEKLAQAEQQLERWEQAAPALAAAEALVEEAEQLASGTAIDDAQLPSRWLAIDIAARTPGLSRRFETALRVIEQRRLAYVRAMQHEQGAARQQLHALLHAAEQALAAGQLHDARSAADEARALKAAAGQLPKPSVQRLSRVLQQLGELERWQQFGQQTARVQLCERAEALLQQTLASTALAREVQQLRAEWKKLDEQHANVPKPLWERFDGACEKAYAPAARHFAELAAQHKQARKQREDFIAAAAAHAPTLLGEPRDWRAIEQWLRETDSTWHGKSLGSVEPGTWKKLDTRMKAALAPLRDELSAARQQAKTERQALITEAESVAAKPLERDAPSRVRDLQARWQTQSKSMPLAPRDERVLWERFRTACNAVFDARKNLRKEADERKSAQRRGFETLCEQLEQLAQASDKDEAQLRGAQRELQDQWRKAVAEGGPVPAALEARFRTARTSVEEALRRRANAQKAAVWRTLLDKERLCAELDALVSGERDAERAATVVESVLQRWTALPSLAAAWEQKLTARRDAAQAALADDDARDRHIEQMEKSIASRRDALLELELMLGLDSPPDLQPQRIALQVKRLRDRFKRAAESGTATADQLLVEWCAQPGVADERDRQRCERIIASIERQR
jgi:hypothetical protein